MRLLVFCEMTLPALEAACLACCWLEVLGRISPAAFRKDREMHREEGKFGSDATPKMLLRRASIRVGEAWHGNVDNPIAQITLAVCFEDAIA